MKKIVVIGAGGFGREALDVIEALNFSYVDTLIKVVGVIDDAPTDLSLRRLRKRNYNYIGARDRIQALPEETKFVVAIGNPAIRSELVSVCLSYGLSPTSLIHPTAIIGSQTEIGEGVVICAGTNLSTNVYVSDYVHLNPGSIVGHDTVIKNFSSVNPGAIISGEVEVGESVLVGAGSVILQGLTIGDGAIVGASACVTRNVMPFSTVKGIPAR